jgi:hypothetical protein
MKTGNYLAVALGFLGIAALASAQQMISAKAGLVNYIEGKVLLDGKAIEAKFGNFPSVNNQSELRTTEEGRAEVLLAPGVFLRMGESSAFKMVSNRISDTRLEFLGGSMILECAELEKDQGVTIVYKDTHANLFKKGVYRLDSEPARLMVYDGEAQVARDGQVQIVGKSKMLALTGIAVAEKFDNKEGDALYRWAQRRSGYLAVANVSAARSVNNSGLGYSSYSGFGYNGLDYGYGGLGFNGLGGWAWNPFFGTYTFLPVNGFYDSFWGYRYWSPSQVGMFYVPYGTHYGGPVRAATVGTTSAAKAISTTSSVHSAGVSRVSSPGRMSSVSTVQSRGMSSAPAVSSGGRATR